MYIQLSDTYELYKTSKYSIFIQMKDNKVTMVCRLHHYLLVNVIGYFTTIIRHTTIQCPEFRI